MATLNFLPTIYTQSVCYFDSIDQNARSNSRTPMRTVYNEFENKINVRGYKVRNGCKTTTLALATSSSDSSISYLKGTAVPYTWARVYCLNRSFEQHTFHKGGKHKSWLLDDGPPTANQIHFGFACRVDTRLS